MRKGVIDECFVRLQRKEKTFYWQRSPKDRLKCCAIANNFFARNARNPSLSVQDLPSFRISPIEHFPIACNKQEARAPIIRKASYYYTNGRRNNIFRHD